MRARKRAKREASDNSERGKTFLSSRAALTSPQSASVETSPPLLSCRAYARADVAWTRMKIDRQKLAFLLGMAISALFLALAFRGLQPEQFWASLGQLDLPILLLSGLAYLLALLIIAWRWQFLLRGIRLVPVRALAQIVCIGYMGNNVYPLRAGDALRIVLLSRNHALPAMRAATVVVIERLLDGSVMIAFVLFSLLFIDLESDTLSRITAAAIPLFIAALLGAAFLAAKPGLLRRLVTRLRPALPAAMGKALARLCDDVIAGLAGFRNPAHLGGAILASLLTWGVEAGTYWLVMFAFGWELSYAVALLLVGAVNLAGLIPASPGQVGVNEFVVITILTALGVSSATATAYAVTSHLVIWLPPTLLGFLLLLRQGLGISDIRLARESKRSAH